MKVVVVNFMGSDRPYEYFTNLDLDTGAIYNITADGSHTYSNPVVIVGHKLEPSFGGKLRTITSAKCLRGLPRKPHCIKKVIFNKVKRTTVVVWIDGVVTKLKCSENDEWDEEKALAFCMVKRFFGNKGYYNDYFRDLIGNAERDYPVG